MPKFYVVATPIGNLEDITLRALRILKEVDLILCEDTRVTKRLLDKYGIQTPMLSYHSHSGALKIEKVLDFLKEKKDLALVSDAGTPTISDPGSLLISKIKEASLAEVITVPGPSALTAALSVSSLPASEFLFLGFLPHKKGRQTLFTEIAQSKRPVVFYESPHRILKTLESLKERMPTRRVIVARELTKIYEETVEGTADKLIAYFGSDPKKIKGEFVVIVEGR
jgi:16S rRNA (cytidine1402-2'-O)-methyltransferase